MPFGGISYEGEIDAPLRERGRKRVAERKAGVSLEQTHMRRWGSGRPLSLREPLLLARCWRPPLAPFPATPGQRCAFYVCVNGCERGGGIRFLLLNAHGCVWTNNKKMREKVVFTPLLRRLANEILCKPFSFRCKETFFPAEEERAWGWRALSAGSKSRKSSQKSRGWWIFFPHFWGK